MYRVARKRADLLRMLLVTTAAMLAIWVLALVETKNTAAADSPPRNGKIAFTRHQSHQSGVGYDIYTVNPDGSNLSRLINNNETAYLPQPAWSPDGTKIAFPYGNPKVGVGPNDSIGVMDTNGSNLRVLTPNLWYVSHSNLAWSPDGKKLAFKSKINELGESLFDIYTMDIEGSSTTNITNTPQIQESSIDFSPDGSQMCLQRDFAPEKPGQEGIEKEGLYVMNVDTSDPTLLTDLHGVECVWSPDGTKIAYDLWDPRPAGHAVNDHEVYVMNAEGSGKTNLTRNRKGSDCCPEWSPDGTRVAFASDRDGDSDIYTMDADGSDVTQVTNLPGYELYPDWQPLTSKSRSLAVHPAYTGGPSFLLVASALLISGGTLLYAGLRRSM